MLGGGVDAATLVAALGAGPPLRVCVCVCVCVCVIDAGTEVICSSVNAEGAMGGGRSGKHIYIYTNTHTHMCVCM